jgi:hypothetical protein
MLIIRKPNGFTYYIFDILRRVFYMGVRQKEDILVSAIRYLTD